jgi:hypothetical protein
MASVFVKRAGDARARFTEVAIFEDDTVTRLAKRCSLERGWSVDAAYVDLFLVKSAGSEDFRTPTQVQIDAVLADEHKVLGEGMPLSRAGIASGAWIVARLHDPPSSGERWRAQRLAGLRAGFRLGCGATPFPSPPFHPTAGDGGSVAAAASHRGVEERLPLTFERLLLESGLRPSDIEAPALTRARIKYGHLVTLAIMEHSPSLAVEAYELGKRLPSTATAQELRIAGYKMNGLL